jgi:hypothetical protein
MGVDQGEDDVSEYRAVRPHGVLVEKGHFAPKGYECVEKSYELRISLT